MVNRCMKRRQASLTTREMQTHTSDSRPEAEGAASVCGGALRGCRLMCTGFQVYRVSRALGTDGGDLYMAM